LWRCVRCYSEWSSAGPCGTCWAHVTLPVPVSRDGRPYGSPEARPYRRRYKDTAPLAEVLATSRAPHRTRWGTYPALLLPLRTSVLVSGPPGSGKSTLAAVVALVHAMEGRRVLYIPAEEGAGPTTVARFERVMEWFGNPKLPQDAPRISDRRNLRDVHEEVAEFERGGPGVLVLDSLTTLGADPTWIEELAAGPLGVLAVAQVNSRGAAFGGPRQAHDVDVVVSVEDGVATIEKSRWLDPEAPRSWAIRAVDGATAPPGAEVIPFRGGSR
jgi:predicted ATP-dependent serine protease